MSLEQRAELSVTLKFAGLLFLLICFYFFLTELQRVFDWLISFYYLLDKYTEVRLVGVQNIH